MSMKRCGNMVWCEWFCWDLVLVCDQVMEKKEQVACPEMLVGVSHGKICCTRYLRSNRGDRRMFSFAFIQC